MRFQHFYIALGFAVLSCTLVRGAPVNHAIPVDITTRNDQPEAPNVYSRSPANYDNRDVPAVANSTPQAPSKKDSKNPPKKHRTLKKKLEALETRIKKIEADTSKTPAEKNQLQDLLNQTKSQITDWGKFDSATTKPTIKPTEADREKVKKFIKETHEKLKQLESSKSKSTGSKGTATKTASESTKPTGG